MDHPQFNWIANFIWGVADNEPTLPLLGIVAPHWDRTEEIHRGTRRLPLVAGGCEPRLRAESASERLSMQKREYSGHLELTWTNKHHRLLAHRNEGYEWVPPHDYRVSEVRLLRDAALGSAVCVWRTSTRPSIRVKPSRITMTISNTPSG